MEKLFLISQSDLDDLLEKAFQKFTSVNKSTPSTPLEEELPIGINELSGILDKAPQTIYGLVNRKKIPYHKQGKKLYFFKSEILQWIKIGKESKASVQDKVDSFLETSRKKFN